MRDYIAARVDELTVITPEVLDNFEPALRNSYHGNERIKVCESRGDDPFALPPAPHRYWERFESAPTWQVETTPANSSLED